MTDGSSSSTGSARFDSSSWTWETTRFRSSIDRTFYSSPSQAGMHFPHPHLFSLSLSLSHPLLHNQQSFLPHEKLFPPQANPSLTHRRVCDVSQGPHLALLLWTITPNTRNASCNFSRIRLLLLAGHTLQTPIDHRRNGGVRCARVCEPEPEP